MTVLFAGEDRALHPRGDPGDRDLREGEDCLPPADRPQGRRQDPQQAGGACGTWSLSRSAESICSSKRFSIP